MFKFFLVTSLLGAIANLVQAPWNFFFLIFLIFPILHIILDKIIRDQKYRERFISIFILLGGFFYSYFLFGFSWIIYAFEFKPELSYFNFLYNCIFVTKTVINHSRYFFQNYILISGYKIIISIRRFKFGTIIINTIIDMIIHSI